MRILSQKKYNFKKNIIKMNERITSERAKKVSEIFLEFLKLIKNFRKILTKENNYNQEYFSQNFL